MSIGNNSKQLYADVIIPLKFKDYVTYSVPSGMEGSVVVGSIVKITLVGREYTAVVRRISDTTSIDPKKIKPIKSIVPFPPVTEKNMLFLEQVAGYYMCPVGDAFRFAAPSTVKSLKKDGKTKVEARALLAETDETVSAVPTEVCAVEEADSSAGNRPHCGEQNNVAEDNSLKDIHLPVLSEAQQKAVDEIRIAFDRCDNALLHGVTGSGKTEIYIRLAAEAMQRGKSVLLLVPEIAMSRQIQKRLETYFGNSLLTYHSKQTPAQRRETYRTIAENKESHIILGLRSALFLPYRDLGLIIVDEEHDTSYKQTDPAPRYHGRDTALMLGKLMECPVLLGSATPSFESLYNVATGKLEYIPLPVRYYGDANISISLVDMVKERRKNAVKGVFSLTLLKAIKQRLDKGEQCLIFRSRRAYATTVECTSCGHVPRCPKCNIPLSYHKFNGSLSCHYCGYATKYQEVCPECGNGEMRLFGAGTEKIEEELRQLFPEATIERFDADSTASKKEEERIFKQFASGKIDILVGTQMISKGFDFSNLTLTAVVKAEAITSLFDFRADEKALQLLRQLMGRAGRRGGNAEMIIQTNHPNHPVFLNLEKPCSEMETALLEERRNFNFPPYIRLVRLTVKSGKKEEAESIAQKVLSIIVKCGVRDFNGPVPPPQEKFEGEYRLQFLVKLPRKGSAVQTKRLLFENLRFIPSDNCTIDVDAI